MSSTGLNSFLFYAVDCESDEPRKQNNDKLPDKAVEYAEGLTIHGLSKALLSSSFSERLFWTMTLLLAVAMACFMVRTLAVKFFNRDVYIDSSTVKTRENIFPAVSICVNEVERNNFCGYHIGMLLPIFYGDIMCPDKVALEPPNSSTRSTGTKYTWGLIQTSIMTFQVSCFQNMDCDEYDVTEKVFTPTENSPNNCVTFNWNGTFFNLKNRVELYVDLMAPTATGDLVMYVHDHKVSPITMDHFIHTNIQQNVDLIFKKVVTERLNRSPPHDCFDEENDTEKSIFPGKYTTTGCLDTQLCKATLFECGVALDFCVKYIPEDLKIEHRNNKTNRENHECLRRGFRNDLFNVDPSLCPPPCKETKFQTVPSGYVKSLVNTFKPQFKLLLAYEERDSYELNTEKEIYSWSDLISGVGGMIGLFCGFSLLSVIELIIFIGLKLFEKKKIHSMV